MVSDEIGHKLLHYLTVNVDFLFQVHKPLPEEMVNGVSNELTEYCYVTVELGAELPMINYPSRLVPCEHVAVPHFKDNLVKK